MKVEVETFYDGSLKVLIRFEPTSNFWKETLTWVPTIKEIELILNTLLGIDAVNRWKKYRRNSVVMNNRGRDEMKKRKVWKCDFEGCEEMAQWYRKWKGELLKLCTKHEAYLARMHYGRPLDPSELDEDDLRYLEEKEEGEEDE